MARIFISSRFAEFESLRKALAQRVKALPEHEIVDLDDGKSTANGPRDRSVDEIEHSDVVLVLAGQSYAEHTDDRLSTTHLEIRTAFKKRIPMLAYESKSDRRDPRLDRMISEIKNADRCTVGRLRDNTEDSVDAILNDVESWFTTHTDSSSTHGSSFGEQLNGHLTYLGAGELHRFLPDTVQAVREPAYTRLLERRRFALNSIATGDLRGARDLLEESFRIYRLDWATDYLLARLLEVGGLQTDLVRSRELAQAALFGASDLVYAPPRPKKDQLLDGQASESESKLTDDETKLRRREATLTLQARLARLAGDLDDSVRLSTQVLEDLRPTNVDALIERLRGVALQSDVAAAQRAAFELFKIHPQRAIHLMRATDLARVQPDVEEHLIDFVLQRQVIVQRALGHSVTLQDRPKRVRDALATLQEMASQAATTLESDVALVYARAIFPEGRRGEWRSNELASKVAQASHFVEHLASLSAPAGRNASEWLTQEVERVEQKLRQARESREAISAPSTDARLSRTAPVKVQQPQPRPRYYSQRGRDRYMVGAVTVGTSLFLVAVFAPEYVGHVLRILSLMSFGSIGIIAFLDARDALRQQWLKRKVAAIAARRGRSSAQLAGIGVVLFLAASFVPSRVGNVLVLFSFFSLVSIGVFGAMGLNDSLRRVRMERAEALRPKRIRRADESIQKLLARKRLLQEAALVRNRLLQEAVSEATPTVSAADEAATAQAGIYGCERQLQKELELDLKLQRHFGVPEGTSLTVVAQVLRQRLVRYNRAFADFPNLTRFDYVPRQRVRPGQVTRVRNGVCKPGLKNDLVCKEGLNEVCRKGLNEVCKQGWLGSSDDAPRRLVRRVKGQISDIGLFMPGESDHGPDFDDLLLRTAPFAVPQA